MYCQSTWDTWTGFISRRMPERGVGRPGRWRQATRFLSSEDNFCECGMYVDVVVPGLRREVGHVRDMWPNFTRGQRSFQLNQTSKHKGRSQPPSLKPPGWYLNHFQRIDLADFPLMKRVRGACVCVCVGTKKIVFSKITTELWIVYNWYDQVLIQVCFVYRIWCISTTF